MRTLTRALAAALVSTSLLSAVPSYAAMPVVDVKSIAEAAKNGKILAEQLRNAIEMVNLQKIAGELLGKGVGTDVAALLDETTGLYGSASSLYYSVSTKQARLAAEWNSMVPSNMDNMDLGQMVIFANRWRGAFREDTMNAARLSAESMKVNAQLHRAVAQKQIDIDTARSALAATQAMAHIGTNMSLQLGQIDTTLSLLAQHEYAKSMQEYQQDQAAASLREQTLQEIRDGLARGPSQLSKSPVQWGR